MLETWNRTLWSWEARTNTNPNTSLPYIATDGKMNSKFIGYTMGVKSTAFIPSIFAFSMFFLLVSLYGRFPATEKLFRFPSRLLMSASTVAFYGRPRWTDNKCKHQQESKHELRELEDQDKASDKKDGVVQPLLDGDPAPV